MQYAAANVFHRCTLLSMFFGRYHALKMQEVNDTLQSLWHDVYTGTGD